MNTILLIEDDAALRENTEELLELSNYNVITAPNGKIGIEKAKAEIPNIIICDIMMPEVDGYGVLKNLSLDDKTQHIPFIFLSAKTEHKEIRKGMNLGADDYLTKPFHNEELLARVKALIRRASGQANPVIQFGPISLDTVAEEITVNDAPLELTAYEYKVMEYLMLNPQKVVSKTELTEHIYDQDFDLDSNVIEVFVGRLRKKLDPENSFKPIETLRGRGYRINRNL